MPILPTLCDQEKLEYSSDCAVKLLPWGTDGEIL